MGCIHEMNKIIKTREAVGKFMDTQIILMVSISDYRTKNANKKLNDNPFPTA